MSAKDRALFFALVASTLRQIAAVPEKDLTIERVTATFADRFEADYKDFDRTVFIQLSGVTPRMIEDAEAIAGGAVTTPEAEDLQAFNDSKDKSEEAQYLAG